MKQILKLILWIPAALVLLWLGKKLLPMVAPFLIALLGAVVMNPAVTALCRKGVPRPLAAGVMTGILLTGCLGVLVCCAVGSARMVSAYASSAPATLDRIALAVSELQHAAEQLLKSVPNSSAIQLPAMMDKAADRLAELPLFLSQRALESATQFAKASPDGLLFVCTTVIGIYYFTLYLPQLGQFFLRQFPPAVLARLQLVLQVLRHAAGGYLKVQCFISGVTFLLMLTAFWLMDISNPIPAAAAIALIDALPIFGAGIVLVPWALIALALGNTGRAAALATVYALLLVTHNALQAKLMGSQLGLHPITALVSLYAGWKLGGLWGMLLLPVCCVVVCSLNDAGILKLYR